ncbi:MAG TPA: PAS domain-containing protein [Rhizomicrobium sp.]|jgi:hypothetical protein|nr:PAS domain-containing protein [Rhizomicrobium sp.]
MLQHATTDTIPITSVADEIDPHDAEAPVVREGYAYWLSKRGTRAFPQRTDINPAQIKKILPNIILAKVLDDGEDFAFRIVGEAVATAHGFNPINWRVSDLDRHAPGFSAIVKRVYRKIYDTNAPYASRGTLRHIDRSYRMFESLFLPLGPANGPVDHVMVVADFSSERRLDA